MESPPSSSTWSEAFILSDDSGLLLTNGSGSTESKKHFHFEDSDCVEGSFSQCGSLDGEQFNTLKKVPNWTESKTGLSPLEPPVQFQDHPRIVEMFSDLLSKEIVAKALFEFKVQSRIKLFKPVTRYFTQEFMKFSPNHLGRPGSRSSLGSSRLSSSHNSLSVPAAAKVDDSTFITQAVSHDTLSSNQIMDLYNVPFDSDVYAVPVDVVKPPRNSKVEKPERPKKRKRISKPLEMKSRTATIKVEKVNPIKVETKRHSLAGESAPNATEPIHMTLQEVRQYLQNLYSSSDSDSSKSIQPQIIAVSKQSGKSSGGNKKFMINIKNKKVKDSCEVAKISLSPKVERKKTSRLFSLKQSLCNMFRFKRILSPEPEMIEQHNNITNRALPPLPDNGEPVLDYSTNIQKVKDCGWYWGPISSETAEKVLSNEPDGSFIVRDSSDDHYIFSLTFKLNNSVRHVRIEHDQGTFSFGSCTKFKSQTIVEFIENAVEHSRSGKYLFFLHRRPVIGPVRVQLLHPVSRFRHVQSLQHICRFVIHKVVRWDLIPSLPLPRRMIDYLNTPNYISESFTDLEVLELPDRSPTPVRSFDIVQPITNPVPVNNYVVINNSPPDRRQS